VHKHTEQSGEPGTLIDKDGVKMLNIWDILEIKPTEDTGVIRKAYAAKLKIHHPEDDPAGYQRLREAFDRAMKLAKAGFLAAYEDELDEDEEELDDEDYDGQENEPREIDSGSSLLEEENFHDDLLALEGEDGQEQGRILSRVPPVIPDRQKPNPYELINAFMKDLDCLYGDISLRCQPGLWSQLLNHEIMWKLGSQRILKEQVLDFLEEHYFLPEEVWGMLVSAFGLRELASDDPEEFQEEYPKVCEYMLRSSTASRLGCSGLPSGSGMDYEDYLHLREKFIEAWEAFEMEKARQILFKLLPVRGHSPMLMRMALSFYCEELEWQEALELCNEFLARYPDDEDMIVIRCRLLLKMNRLEEAWTELDGLNVRQNGSLQVLSLMGECQLRMGQAENARGIYERLLQLSPGDADAITGLAKADEAALTTGSKNRRRARQIRKEWGRQPFIRTLRNSVYFLFKRWPLLLLLVLLHTLLASSLSNNLDMSLMEYARYTFSKPAVPLIETGEELKALPAGSAVRINLTKDTVYSGIVKMEKKEKNGAMLPAYMLQKEAEEKDSLGDLNGYISAGYMDRIRLVILTNYKQAREIYEKKETREVQGVLQDAHSPEWSAFKEYWNNTPRFVNDLPEDTVFLNIRDGLEGSLYQVKIPVMAGIYAGAIILMYALLVRQFHKYWRYIRYR
jgi:tetratricopeptide (TPR) repeat protein